MTQVISENNLVADTQNDLLSTQQVRASLKSRTISGGIFRVGALGCEAILTFGYNAALARLLTPEDFGLFAMVSSSAALLRIFKDAGLSTATIQREEIDHAQVSNLFWINLCVSIVISLILASSAPLIAGFFHQPQLIPLTLTFSFVFFTDGLAVQHMALLNRRLQFKTISMIEIVAMTAGFTVGISAALLNWGYWSLVFASLSTSAVRLITVWTVVPWRPKRPSRGTGIRPLVSFGANLTVVGVLHACFQSSQNLLIGRFLGSQALGLYSRATALFVRPLEQFTVPLQSLLVPVLSRMQSEPVRYRRTFLLVFDGLVILGLCFTGLFLPLADPLVAVILGPKWDAVTPIFAILAASALCYPLLPATSWLLTSQGRGKDLLRVSGINSSIGIVLIIAGLWFGPLGVAVGYSASIALVKTPIMFFLSGRKGPLRTADLWFALLRQLPVGVSMLVATFAASFMLATASPLVRLLVCASVGLLAGMAAVLLSPPSRRTVKHLYKVFAELRNSRAYQHQ